MELVITEKPSVAQSIAKVIGADKRCDGYLKGGGYIVSWCVGHLVELASPEAYDEAYRSWSYDTLPILPVEWKYVIKKDTKAQFKVLKDLMKSKEVTSVICATDAGREGELIFRLVYEQAGCSKPFKRLWISSMEEGAIRDGFRNLKPGTDYDNLYASALCRQQADWLVGLNGTRLFTVLYKRKILKVGRVQTPTLAMLVDREMEIGNFKKTPYYTVSIKSGEIEAVSEKYQDRDKADDLAVRCAGKEAVVTSVTSEEKCIAAPKLYDLTTLQRDANRIFSFTAKQTLGFTQSLYEKKLCTYPRTDSQYLSDDMEDTARRVSSSAHGLLSYEIDKTEEADYRRIMDSTKVTDHHAIIPTVEIDKVDLSGLSDGESKILKLLEHRLLCATCKAYRYRSVKAEITCGDCSFRTSGSEVLDEGWKKYDREFMRYFKVKDGNEEEKVVPDLSEGMVLSGANAKVVSGFTQPPKHYTEDSLLSAMERAGTDDMSDDVERKGLGTPATRADIIEKLVRDGFVKRDKKQLLPTEEGMKLITVMPDVVKSPKLTADWENTLALVAKGEYPAEQFMRGVKTMVTDLVNTYDGIREEHKDE